MYRKPGGLPLLLVFPFGLLSHYLRCLVLCRKLSAYFEIRFASHPLYQPFVEREGFESFGCAGFDSASVVEELKRFQFTWLKSSLPETLFNDQVSVIKKLQPVAVLGDHTPTLKMAAETTGVFYISLINGYLSRLYAGHRNISKRHPMYQWISLLNEPLKSRLTRWGEARAFRQLHKNFRMIRDSNGLQKKQHYLQELEGDLTLICDLPELFPQHPLPPSYLNTGPLFYDLDKSGGTAIIEPDRTRKNIIVAMGSTGEWKHVKWLNDPFYNRYSIIALGDQDRTLNAPHVRHVVFGSSDQLFPSADLLICHGGNGTLYQGLQHGLPILAFTAHCDHEWNIAALEKYQLVCCLDGIVEPDRFKQIIRENLSMSRDVIRETFRQSVARSLRNLPATAAQIASMVMSNAISPHPERVRNNGARDKIRSPLETDQSKMG